MSDFHHETQHNALDDREPIPSHSMVEHESHITHYPNHPARTESATYKATHRRLCIEQDKPCFVCGFRHSERGSKVVTTETHHFGMEWAFQQAADWHKFKAKMGELAEMFAKMAAIDPEEVAKDPTAFVDGMDQMLVLCSIHHRDPAKGIHAVPFPEWILQAVAMDGFEVLERANG